MYGGNVEVGSGQAPKSVIQIMIIIYYNLWLLMAWWPRLKTDKSTENIKSSCDRCIVENLEIRVENYVKFDWRRKRSRTVGNVR